MAKFGTKIDTHKSALFYFPKNKNYFLFWGQMENFIFEILKNFLIITHKFTIFFMGFNNFNSAPPPLVSDFFS